MFQWIGSGVKKSLVLKMKAVCTPETLLDVYQTAWCHIPEDCTLHIHCMRTLHLGNSKIVCKN